MTTVKHGSTVVFRQTCLRPLQELRDVMVPTRCCKFLKKFSFTSPYITTCTEIQQQPHDILMSKLHCTGERIVCVIERNIRIEVVVQQQLHDLAMAVARRKVHERR